MTHRTMPAAEYRSIASAYKAKASEPGISPRRVSLLTNISRSFIGLATQLDMLAADMSEEQRKLL